MHVVTTTAEDGPAVCTAEILWIPYLQSFFLTVIPSFLLYFFPVHNFFLYLSESVISAFKGLFIHVLLQILNIYNLFKNSVLSVCPLTDPIVSQPPYTIGAWV